MQRAHRDLALALLPLTFAATLLGCTAGQLGSDSSGSTGDRVDLDRPGDPYGPADDGSDPEDPADPGDGEIPDPGDAGDGGEDVPGSLCEACITASCQAEYQACGDVAECVALDQCAGACDDEACYTQCEQSHPTGTEPLFAFYDCLDTNCAEPCGGGAEDPGDGGAEDPGDGGQGEQDPCGACVDATCGAAWQACEADADCMALLGCYEPCADNESCWYDCEEQHATGANVYFAFLDCVYGSCSAECPAE